MNQGLLIYAHNSRDIDYAKLSIVAGGLAKKNLSKPVSLITDKSTVAWMNESELYDLATDIFDNVILTEKPENTNKRNLHDGNEKSSVPFLNTNRSSAYDLSPYDQTLLIDSDFLIFSNNLNNYWNDNSVPVISSAFKDACDIDRRGYHDKYTSDTGVKLYWATTLMFNKTSESKTMFDLVAYVRKNYQYYSDLFRFHPGVYRNDIAFSIARHLMYGFQIEETEELPPVLSCIDKDMLHSVDDNGALRVLFSVNNESNYVLGAFRGLDLHVMNKQSIIRNYESFLKLI
jgi:hypothetical protein